MSEAYHHLNSEMNHVRTHFILDIICHSDDLFIVLPNRLHLARLNIHLVDALINHVKSGSIQLEALLNKRSILE